MFGIFSGSVHGLSIKYKMEIKFYYRNILKFSSMYNIPKFSSMYNILNCDLEVDIFVINVKALI